MVVGRLFYSIYLPFFSMTSLLADAASGYGTPRLVTYVSTRNDMGIRSLAVKGSQLIVGYKCKNPVEVYVMTTFTLQRRLTTVERVSGLAACGINNCLYVSDLSAKVTTNKVDLSTHNTVLTWSVSGYCNGMLENTMRNVLISCYTSNEILMYTTVGKLVREVFLGGIIPFQAVQLPSGQLVVSQYSPLHRVCVVGYDGKEFRSYGNTAGSQYGQLNEPRGLALYGKQSCFSCC